MWQEELKHNITTVEELGRHLTLTEQEKTELEEIVKIFPLSVSRYYFNLIDRQNPNDPIRKLCIPSHHEFDQSGMLDTSGEARNTKINGLQHKYGPTALMLSTNLCPTYCRFCFRRRMVGSTEEEIVKQIDKVADYVREHPEIDNILVSGGDALMNSNRNIRHILELFTGIETVRFIRFGTRMLAFLPQRINEDDELIEILSDYTKKKQIYVIAHFEHPREMTDDAFKAVKKLQSAGVIMRNQTVLLNGVNDDPDTLSSLMNGLTSWGIMPYYIFQCRPVSGVKKHFQVPLLKGCRIIDEAKKTMSGPAKQLRYAMSHETGKIEIVGMQDDKNMIFKYHQAKDSKDNARIFTADVSGGKTWLSSEDVLI